MISATSAPRTSVSSSTTASVGMLPPSSRTPTYCGLRPARVASLRRVHPRPSRRRRTMAPKRIASMFTTRDRGMRIHSSTPMDDISVTNRRMHGVPPGAKAPMVEAALVRNAKTRPFPMQRASKSRHCTPMVDVNVIHGSENELRRGAIDSLAPIRFIHGRAIPSDHVALASTERDTLCRLRCLTSMVDTNVGRDGRSARMDAACHLGGWLPSTEGARLRPPMPFFRCGSG